MFSNIFVKTCVFLLELQPPTFTYGALAMLQLHNTTHERTQLKRVGFPFFLFL